MQFTGHLTYLLYAASIALAIPLEKRSGTSYSGSTTANDVENGVCADVTFIFARGSTESGNMGNSVGPALAQKLISTLGADKMAIQGVTYTASIESNVEMGSGGGPVMKQLADKALSACSDTKIVLSGYSQGAMVVHYAVKTSGLSPDDITAVALYGDPEDGTSVGSLPSSKLKEFCGKHSVCMRNCTFR
ncbi:alpha/beta-hydrolase [Teratosphaeria nubilosa]|uniref:cutinase n=1 Tax=Teratosphaeria nubilosa TaxID=161662 RepID=A0A6G1LHJ0_9PEZI|nr:alpha/beta-hydrolase [Teratosphaeria nubilosa]